MDYILDIFPIVISVIALFVSVHNLFSSKIRERKQATLDAFDILQREVLDGIRNVKKKDTIKLGRMGKESNPELWRELTLYLVRLERFSVGVNTRVYDLRVLNRLVGSYLIDVYYIIEPVIIKKREMSANIKKPNKKTYDEFERVIERLEKIRKRTPKAK
ncbi:MAG: DUF4760 domain-containing protein [Defluviitaleaceae bacterium]|nr:DUF4760 domain-containing protein [Defluviitaleaceae bacterium]